MNLIEQVLDLDGRATKGPIFFEHEEGVSIVRDFRAMPLGTFIEASRIETGEPRQVVDEEERRANAQLFALYRTAAPKLARALANAMEYIDSCSRGGIPLAGVILEEIEKEIAP